VLPGRFPGLALDAFVVMPNHVHGIAAFVGAGLALPVDEGAASSAPTSGDGVARGVPTLADVIRAFKSLSAIHVNRLLRRSGSVWQRSYFDHVVRDDRDLERIREYTATNPLRWALGHENPERTGASTEEDSLFDLHRPP
jgi:putative transposase